MVFTRRKRPWDRNVRRGRDRNVCPILKLHDDQLALIVSRLPLQEVFQLRCVCKMWKILFTDDWVFKWFIRFLTRTPIFTASLDSGLAAYNVETRNWDRWTSALHARQFSGYSRVYGNLGDWLLVEDGSVKEHPLRNLCLVNPTKSSSKKLSNANLTHLHRWRPGVLQLNYCSVGLAVGLIPCESSKSCRAFIVNFENPDWDDPVSSYVVYLYDSNLDSWKAIWPWELPFHKTVGSITFYEGVLHCIIQEVDESDKCYWTTKVCRYDEQKSCLQEFSAQISGKFHFQQPFEWQGRLMLIGGRDGAQQNDSGSACVNILQESGLTSVHIWELDKGSHVWRESTRMPDSFLDHLCPSEFDLPKGSRRVGSLMLFEGQLSCETCGRFICLTNSLNVDLGPHVYGVIKQNYHRHVMCDLSKNSWWEVPKPSFPYESLGFCHLTPKSE